MVLVYHVRLNILVAQQDVTPSYDGVIVKAIYLATDCGHQAVIWFFVISGFLVGGSVVNDIRRDRFQFGRYAINRFSRLYVVLIPALLIGYCIDEARIFLHGMSTGPEASTPLPIPYGL